MEWVHERESGLRVGPDWSQQRLVWNVFFVTSWNLQVFRQAAVAVGEAGLESGGWGLHLLPWPPDVGQDGQLVKGHCGRMSTKRSYCPWGRQSSAQCRSLSSLQGCGGTCL